MFMSNFIYIVNDQCDVKNGKIYVYNLFNALM